ncbi:MAG TPA: tetratricopeptide repeat protein [Planctomycetota bacterium]|nr:tetratricopeptide repeat protein [Planctomycetota bacterium]
MRCPRLLPLLGALAAACSTASVGLPPDSIVDLPWSEAPADLVAMNARSEFERGHARQALAMVEGLLAAEPRHVDANRVRQDILRERGRRGLLWQEAERALERRADDGLALYLLGRVVTDDDVKLRSFARAAQLWPQSVWPWLGLAHTLRRHDPGRALAIYERLYQASGRHPLVGIAYAALLRDAQRIDAAVSVYEALRADSRVAGIGDLGLAQAWLAREDRAHAWVALLAALRQRPFDPGVQGIVANWLYAGASDDQAAQVLDVLREDADRMRVFGTGEGAPVLAQVLQRAFQPQAVAALLAASGVDARQPALRRLQRRLVLGLGDVRQFLEMVRTDVPSWLVGADPNMLRGRWLSLLQGPWYDGDPLASADQAVALLESLRAVGWLAEVELLAESVAHRWPGAGARAVALRDEARRELAFEGGIRRLLYHGYQTGDTSSLETVVERVRALSMQVFGRDVIGQPKTFSVPMVGEMLDPFVGSLSEHFDLYNRHFVLGRRSGGMAEGMLFTRLSLSDLPQSADVALPGRCFEVIAMDRDVRAIAGALGGDLAGVALLNHFLIDFDAVREWARGVADRRRIAAEDGNALLHDPLPESAGYDPLDVAWRLSVMSPVRDEDLDAAVLDTIKNHERQHLVDSFHYLPVESNLWRGLGLLLQFALSPSAIEAEMERRAELAALVYSPHTELVLAHVADFLGEPDRESPHHGGFGRLGHELVDELRALGVSEAGSLPCRWHELDMAVVRQAGRRLLDRLR